MKHAEAWLSVRRSMRGFALSVSITRLWDAGCRVAWSTVARGGGPVKWGTR